MNYQEYRQYKESITDQTSLLRLDCMNPFKAMAYMKSVKQTTSSVSEGQALDVWADRMGMQSFRDFALASQGVRESLKALFKCFSMQNKQLWLPKDVYPFYWEAASTQMISAHSFSTNNGPDLRALTQASMNSAVVIANPISPLGRRLNKEEVTFIKDWLVESPKRQIVLDTVYDYTSSFDSLTIELFETGQCYIAHSLSKAWLERGTFGVLLTPKDDPIECTSFLVSPSNEACVSAFNVLQQLPELPIKQQAEFSTEWQRLLPEIKVLAPDFMPPASGYFSVIDVDFQRALTEFSTLVIPATVFGSNNADSSIITCLYDIEKGG